MPPKLSYLQGALPRVKALMSEGVTTLEIKSGYGLDIESEKKMLQAAAVIGELNKKRLTVMKTALHAHAIPKATHETLSL